jgi:dsDNA-binding SOS-regulon protein
MIKNRYHSLISKNKTNRYDREMDIAKKLLLKLRANSQSNQSEKQENGVIEKSNQNFG